MSKSQVDIFTGFDVTLDSDHTYIHQGKGYVICGATASIAAGAHWYMSLKTPAANAKSAIHFRIPVFSSTANALALTMVEGATMTGGTSVTPQNLNRYKSNASLVQAATGATLSVAGTGGTVYIGSVGSGGASNRAGGSSGGGEERVLKPDTVYSLDFENVGSSTATVGYYTVFWYEED